MPMSTKLTLNPQATAIKKLLEVNGISLEAIMTKSAEQAETLSKQALAMQETADAQMDEATRDYNEKMAQLKREFGAASSVVTTQRTEAAGLRKRSNELQTHVRRIKT